MGEEKEQVKEISKFISKNFVQGGLKPLVHSNDIETLRELKIYLSAKILDMMDTNYDLLIKTLYRIDISEEKLHDLFAPANREFIPNRLADLIIERQLEKIKWRNRYRSGNF